MLNKKLKLMATLVITVSLGFGTVTVHAATSGSEVSYSTKKVECKVNSNKKCHKPLYSVLKNKLGYTEAQISDAAKAGKTAFDLAKEKGMTDDQLRNEIIKAKSQKIDKMVAEGKIEKDKADTIKANFKAKIQKWDGSLVHKKDTAKTE